MEKPPPIWYKGVKYYACLSVRDRRYYKNYAGKYLHRIIWEEANGPILDGQHIHHINDNPFDNRIENMRLMSPQDHFKHHCPDKAASGAKGGSVKGDTKKRGDADYYRKLRERRFKK